MAHRKNCDTALAGSLCSASYIDLYRNCRSTTNDDEEDDDDYYRGGAIITLML